MHRRNIPHYKMTRRKSSPVSKWSSTQNDAALKKVITEDTNTHMQIVTKDKMPDELKSYNNLAYTFPPYVSLAIILGVFFLLLFLFY